MCGLVSDSVSLVWLLVLAVIAKKLHTHKSFSALFLTKASGRGLKDGKTKELPATEARPCTLQAHKQEELNLSQL